MRLFPFLFLFCLTGAALAEEVPKLAFGTIQQERSVTMTPNSTVDLTVYFFIDAEYGNRNAHVILDVAEAPVGWDIEISPKKHDVLLNISGIVTRTTENLYIEPKVLLSAVPEVPEEGIVYMSSPSGRGFLQAKSAIINVRVPENAEIGKSYVVKIGATANYFGSAGTVLLAQSRSFDYDITVVAPKYTETVIPVEEQVEAETAALQPPVEAGMLPWLEIAIIIVVVAIVIVAAMQLIRRR